MTKAGLSKQAALKFVVLPGVVSLFADMTHEGARSITGPYLGTLGASATIISFVAGFGEFIGYVLRFPLGYLSDRTKRYWLITLLGYFINMAAVPLLALAGNWETAALLMIAERAGRAVRNPARDAMLSHATHKMGRGWGFGLHEAMDQVGAMIGPLLIAAALFLGASYEIGFAILLAPAIATMGIISAARVLYPHPGDLEIDSPALKTEGFPREFWLYQAAVVLIAAGYADFPLIAYHFKKISAVPDSWIPIFYAVAMGVDAVAALIFGRLFDRKGLPILIASSLLSAMFAPLVFLGNFYVALAGMALWGVGMGAQESIMRAAIAEMVPIDKRGTGYGLFNANYGLFWFLGSALMGLLYDISVPWLIVFSTVTQLASVPLLQLIGNQRRTISAT